MAHHDKIIEGRIDELIELIDNSRTPAFGGEDRRVVETGAVTEKFNILKEIPQLPVMINCSSKRKKPKMRFFAVPHRNSAVQISEL